MARLIPHYAMAKKIGAGEIEIEAGSIGEMIAIAGERFGVDDHDLATATILVNGRNINYLQGMKTKLLPDDEVTTVLPSAGG